MKAKKIIPILLIGMFVLGGLEAGALSEIKEDFVYFYDRELIQCCDPSSYGLINGLLIITETKFENEYDSLPKFLSWLQETLGEG